MALSTETEYQEKSGIFAFGSFENIFSKGMISFLREWLNWFKNISCFFSTATQIPQGNTGKYPQVIRPNGWGIAFLCSNTPQCEKKKKNTWRHEFPFFQAKIFQRDHHNTWQSLFWVYQSLVGQPNFLLDSPLRFIVRVLTMAHKLLYPLWVTSVTYLPLAHSPCLVVLQTEQVLSYLRIALVIASDWNILL